MVADLNKADATSVPATLTNLPPLLHNLTKVSAVSNHF